MDAPEAPDPSGGPVVPIADGPSVRPAGQRGRPHPWIVVVLIAVAVVIAAGTVALLVADHAGIHDGPGTATFIWTPVPQNYSVSSGSASTRPQPFNGTIDGVALSGTSTLTIPPGSAFGANGALPTGPIPVFRYRGTLAGTPFDLTLYFRYPTASIPTDAASARAAAAGVHITVAGTYGGSPVRATVSLPSASGPTGAHPATIVGTVGHWKVHGTIPTATGTPQRQTETAHFVISG